MIRRLGEQGACDGARAKPPGAHANYRRPTTRTTRRRPTLRAARDKNEAERFSSAISEAGAQYSQPPERLTNGSRRCAEHRRTPTKLHLHADRPARRTNSCWVLQNCAMLQLPATRRLALRRPNGRPNARGALKTWRQFAFGESSRAWIASRWRRERCVVDAADHAEAAHLARHDR